MNKKTAGISISTIIIYVILIVTSLLCLLPFINLLAISFSGSAPVSAGEVYFIPKEFTLQSYAFALESGQFFTALSISVMRVIVGVLVNLTLMVLVAYPLSKTKDKVKGRNLYMAFFAVTLFINGGMIPTYLVVVNAGLLDTIWALILPTALPVYEMVILMNFVRNLPAEVEEAAMIDGAGPFRTLLSIVLPLLKPALATVGLFCMITHWNDWFNGLIYMNSTENYPLQTYLQSLLKSFEDLMLTADGDYTVLLSMMNARTGRAAQLFLGALPIMLVYPFLQKYFTKGLVMGSVKG